MKEYFKYNLSIIDDKSYERFNFSREQFKNKVLLVRNTTGIGFILSKKVVLKAFSEINNIKELDNTIIDIINDCTNCSVRKHKEI